MSETIEAVDVIDFTSENEKNILKSLLQEGIVNVTFTKKDGTSRVMKATLKSEKIPQSEAPKNENPMRVKSDAVQAVYDLEKEGWRSFRWDSLVEYQIEIEGLEE
jgi:hypothetical protein